MNVHEAKNQLFFEQSVYGRESLVWLAVQTRPRFETKISAELKRKGIETFLPLNAVMHRWSDRDRLVHLPLFPGYVFLRTSQSLSTRVAVLRTTGVMNFVGNRGIGTAIPDSEIEALQTVLDRKIPFEPYPHIKVGQLVRICGGCFEGIMGTLVRINGDRSLVMSIDLIQRSIAVRIAGYNVEAV